jgi:hypothetical protein
VEIGLLAQLLDLDRPGAAAYDRIDPGLLFTLQMLQGVMMHARIAAKALDAAEQISRDGWEAGADNAPLGLARALEAAVHLREPLLESEKLGQHPLPSRSFGFLRH